MALTARFAIGAAIAAHLTALAIFHHTIALTLRAFVLHHLLLGLILLVGFAHGLILTSPAPSAPIVGRQLIGSTLDATRPSAVGRLISRRRLFDRHVGITKTNHLRLAVLASPHYRLLAALNIPAGLITWQVARVHFFRLFILTHPLTPTRR